MSGDANGEERAERYRRQRELENLVTSALVEAMTEPRSETEIYRLLKKLLEIHEEDFRLSRDQVIQILLARRQSKAAANLAVALAKRGFVGGEDVTQLLHWGDLSALQILRLALENRNVYLSPAEAHRFIEIAMDEGMVCAAVDNRLKGGLGLIPRLSSHQVASWMELRTELACRAVAYLGERIGDDPKQGVRGFFVENAKDADAGMSYVIYIAKKIMERPSA
ncbi:MAG TPA: hypothetical protein PKB15_08525 [Acidimicrobiia bacterium]|nr:hypothetical protein [Acidimicrobiia bacterium]